MHKNYGTDLAEDICAFLCRLTSTYSSWRKRLYVLSVTWHHKYDTSSFRFLLQTLATNSFCKFRQPIQFNASLQLKKISIFAQKMLLIIHKYKNR